MNMNMNSMNMNMNMNMNMYMYMRHVHVTCTCTNKASCDTSHTHPRSLGPSTTRTGMLEFYSLHALPYSYTAFSLHRRLVAVLHLAAAAAE